ncbi:sugar ABC transporter permease [Thermus sp. LT1-2-5]|uniref:ABC transporter permease n=1 Tax=Thermus sp. LT1-2-5 TaxID=3026935 RepID=UPI0030EABD16
MVKRALPYYAPALLLTVLVLFLSGGLAPGLLDPFNLSRLLASALPMVFLAAGQTLVVLSGGIDLSLGSLLTFTLVVMVVLFDGVAVGVGLLAGLVAGLIGGAINGVAVAYLRLQPLVATFATGFLFGGLALWVLPRPGGTVPPGLRELLDPPWAPLIPYLLLLGVWVYLRRRPWGVLLYATGGQAGAAYANGVPVARVRVLSYMGAGLLAAFGALFLLVETGTGDPLVGQPMLLGSITAVVLGGTRLSGGTGGLEGSILGALLLVLFRNLVFFLGVPSDLQVLAEGLVVLLALATSGYVLRRGA